MSKARFHSRFFFIVFSSLLLSREAVAIVDSTWNVNANGNWFTPGNWTAGVPQTADDIARFLGVITAPRTVTLDFNAELAQLYFDNANAYTIADAGLTLNFSTSSPVGTTSINITNANGNGNHDLGTSTGFARDLTINHNSTGTFTVSGSLSGPSSVTLTKAGPGTTIFGVGTGSNLIGGSTSVTGGILQLNKASFAIGPTSISLGAKVQNLGDGQILPGSGFSVTGTYDLNGHTDSIGALNGSGSVTLGAGTLNLVQNGFTADFSGVISDGGSAGKITVSGPVFGSQTFSGTSANTYTGQTTVSGGVLQLNKTGVTAVPSTVVLVSGGTLTLQQASQINSAATVTVSSGIFDLNGNAQTLVSLVNSGGTTNVGASTLTLTSSATPLTMGDSSLTNGTVSFTGGTTGSDIVFNGSTGSTVSSNLNLGAAARTFNIGPASGTAMSVSGAISNGSGITKSGTGTLQFSGANTYAGSTTISTGVLQAGAASTFPSGSSFAIAATLDLNTFSQTIDTISGSGSITLNGGTLTTGAAGATSFGGPITDGTTTGGGLTKQNAGTLTLSGANTYTGTTLISTGTLKAGIANTFSAASPHTVNATLDLNSLNQTINTISGSGSGSITLGSALLTTGSSGNSTFSGVISDGGLAGKLTKQNAGTFTLSGANTYTGATTISGGTLQAGAANTFSSTSPHAIAATLNLNTFNQTINTISGSGSITLNGGTLTTGAGVDTSFAGAITDGTTTGGGLTKQNAGTLNLSGANTYTGATLISAGKLQAGATNTFSATSAHTVTAILDLNTFSQIINTISGAGSITLNGGTLTTGAAGATSFSGAITDGTTTGGGLTKQNAGTLTLSGANTYTGTTLISTGTLQAGAANTFSAASAHTVNATLDLNSFNQTINTISGSGSITLGSALLTTGSSGNSTFSGVISDGGLAGKLTKQNSGTFTLSGANTYTGATTISGGTLQAGAANTFSSTSAHSITATLDLNTFNQTINTISGPGSITLNGGTLTTGAAVATSFAGSITDGTTGFGGLTKQNAGTFTLSGTNTYTGATTVSGGTLQASVANTFSPNSDYNIDSVGILDLQAFNQTIGLLSGAGTVTSLATLTTGTSGNSTFSGTLTGGTLNKAGSGILSLTGGASSISAASVSAGRLAVNTGVGTPLVISGSLTVGSGASLGGTGAITCPNITIQSGGTLSPGNSIGTLTVTGAVTQAAGSTFDVELLPSGGTILHDELDITGSYTIQPGATLLIEPGPGVYPSTFSITIVDASAGMLSGQFSNVVITLPTFSATVEYMTGLGDVVLAGISTLPIAFVVTGGNAGAVATCLDTLSPAPGSDMELVIAELRQIPTVEGLRDALDELQPSQYTALALAEESTTLYTNDTIFARLRQVTQVCPYVCSSKPRNEKTVCPPKKSRAFWISPYGATSHQREKNDQPGFKTWTGGATAGMDYSPCDMWTFGGALGYSHDHLNWQEGAGHANMQNGYGALYASLTTHHGFLFGTLMGSYNHYDTRRNIDLGEGVLMTIDRTAKGSHHGGQGSGHLEGGLLYGEKVQFSPFLGMDYIYVHEASFNEHGADSLNLHVKKKNSDLLQGEVGLEISRCFSRSRNHFSPYVAFSAIREWRFMGKHTKSSFKGSSCVMKTTGMNPERTLFSPKAGITFLIPNENCTLSVEYRGKFGEKFNDNRVLAQFLYKF